MRSNFGGATPEALAIAAGMPGAREMEIAACTTRIAGTSPPRYAPTGPDYELTPGSAFDFDGPAAVLVDGRSFSAEDYFARAAKIGTDAVIVGTPTSGAYGGSGATFAIEADTPLMASYDPTRCNDSDGEPLETRGVQPDVPVEYDPEDLAEGRDTVLEAAAAELRASLSP